jgi:ribosome production factor 2
MELLEVGIEEVMAMSSFKVIDLSHCVTLCGTDVTLKIICQTQGPKSAPGSLPLFHFSSTSSSANLWDSHPTYIQFKSILLDFFRGVEMDAVSLKGLERVISVTIGGDSAADAASAKLDVENAAAGVKGKEVDNLMSMGSSSTKRGTEYDEDVKLPVVHFRTYTLSFLRSGLPTPIASLAPHGPHLTFSLRRSQLASEIMMKAALKKTVKKSTLFIAMLSSSRTLLIHVNRLYRYEWP